MIKIGDFSKLCCISIRMLRYYDNKGILKPTFIDNNTGYRYYSIEQIKTLNIIKKLNNLGFNTKIIKEIIDNEAKLNFYLKQQKKILVDELIRVKSISNEINLLLENKKGLEYNVVLKKIPKRTVASVRQIINTYNDEGLLWNILYNEINKKNIKIDKTSSYPIAVYHDYEYKEKNVDVEVMVTVIDSNINSDIINIYTKEELSVISICFSGSYDNMSLVTQKALEWIDNSKYELIQPMFNIYHITPSQESDSNKWITEACFIIKEK